jgi:hypothetical protein
MDFILQPWPWYFSGILIGLSVAALLYFSNKNLGVSSSFKHVCAMGSSNKVSYLNYNWKKELWNLIFIGGIIAGAVLSSLIFGDAQTSEISLATQDVLKSYEINTSSGLLPQELFTWENLFSISGLVFIVLGGFFVGFGTRYAEGCTSGHAIMGLASLQWPSLLAVIFFFVGGLISTYFIIPAILG